MNLTVSTEEKKEFIRYFLKRYKTKRRECIWILNWLLTHEEVLENVHFIDEAHYAPRAMVMSTTKSESIPFRFYKGNLMTADAEKSFHDLRLHDNEKIYIQLNFPNKNTCPKYAAVGEENPFLPSYLQVNEMDRETAKEFMEYMESKMFEDSIELRIDGALESGDKELFMKLTDELNSYKDKMSRTF